VMGWVKVFSDTQPRENIFSYKPWLLYNGEEVLELNVVHWRKQGKTLVAKLDGIDSRESARLYMGSVVAIARSQLPELNEGDFYWNQLVGMDVVSTFGDQPVPLGQVVELIETGANDVLVVRSSDGGTKEHLVPWVLDEFIKKVDLDENVMEVNWDPDF